jgi:hypothetical protein
MARDFANRLKAKYPKICIRWIGLFDTVEQVPFRKYNENIPAGTGHAIQIVAGGERRSLFPGTSIFPNDPAALASYPDGSLREITFGGAVHSDVGGGYKTNRQIANEALKIVHGDGVSHGVPFGPIPSQYDALAPQTPHDSRYITDKIREAIFGKDPRNNYRVTPDDPSAPFHL